MPFSTKQIGLSIPHIWQKIKISEFSTKNNCCLPASCSLQMVHIPTSWTLQVMCIDPVAPLISKFYLYLDDVNLVAPHISKFDFYLDDVYPLFIFKVSMCHNLVVRLNVHILLCPNPQDYCGSERAHIPASCSLQMVHIPTSCHYSGDVHWPCCPPNFNIGLIPG